jgi:hypothetical protein
MQRLTIESCGLFIQSFTVQPCHPPKLLLLFRSRELKKVLEIELQMFQPMCVNDVSAQWWYLVMFQSTFVKFLRLHLHLKRYYIFVHCKWEFLVHLWKLQHYTRSSQNFYHIYIKTINTWSYCYGTELQISNALQMSYFLYLKTINFLDVIS